MIFFMIAEIFVKALCSAPAVATAGWRGEECIPIVFMHNDAVHVYYQDHTVLLVLVSYHPLLYYRQPY